jgi:hypothetical protein
MRVSFSKLIVICFRINGVIKKYKKVSVTIFGDSDHGHGHADGDVRQKDLLYYRRDTFVTVSLLYNERAVTQM